MLLTLVFAVGTVAAWAAREPTTPEEIYAQGTRQLEKGYYTRAIELFERVKTRYPLSQYAVLAELRVGDTHFKQGQYIEAVDAYQGFLRAHPRHEEVPYVVYRIALSEFKDAPKWAQRDQTPTWRMLRTINGNRGAGIPPFEERFPDSEYVDDVNDMRVEGRHRLAAGIYGIGLHYYRKARFESKAKERVSACSAAINRFNEVLDEYPDIEDLSVQSLYYIGLCGVKLVRRDKALETLERMRTRFPNSEYVSRLEKKVDKMHKVVLPPTEGEDEADASPEPAED